MFSKAIVRTDRFLDMPQSCQNLYFHLGIDADDDGFVSPKSVMRLVGSTDDDIKILISKNFLIPFESGVIVITDWKENNYIQSDRYKPTIFQKEYAELSCIHNVYKMDAQVRLGKDRLGYIGSKAAEVGSSTKSKVVEQGEITTKEKPFVYEEVLASMEQNPRKEIKIIAHYWKYKGYVAENKEQYQAAFKRDLKPAKTLIGYTKQQIEDTMDICKNKFEMWTLETVGKRISDVIKN